jgi:transcriptional regulator with XRE-family HTH domain
MTHVGRMPDGPGRDETLPRQRRTVAAVTEGQRIKAALVLAGRTAEEVAPELNVSGRTLNRIIAGERQAREWELDRLADVLAIPAWFLRDGLVQPPADSDDELRDLQARRHDEVVRRLDGIDEQLRVLATQVRDRPRSA